MAGGFIRGFYTSNEGDVYGCRVQPETITSWNQNSEGPATGNVRAYTKGSRRRYGVHARRVTLSRVVGTIDDYDSARVSVTVPIMTRSAYNALSVGQVLTYQEQDDWEVASKSEEVIR
jgi:hypothetical protein